LAATTAAATSTALALTPSNTLQLHTDASHSLLHRRQLYDLGITVTMAASRRRQVLQKQQQQHQQHQHVAAAMSTPSPRVINAAPSLEKAEMYGIDDNRPVFSRAMALAGRMFIETIPQWLAVGAMLSLIFGGCCSNVFALESIVKVEPATGMLSSGRVRARCTLLTAGPHHRNPPDICSVPLRRRHRTAGAV